MRSHPSRRPGGEPDLYLSLPHACPYLPQRNATILVIDPSREADTVLYSRYAQQGFRRSAGLVYRPHCEACNACISVRIPVAEFRPSRSQRRNLRVNEPLAVSELQPAFREEHFLLYRRYQHARHRGSTMDDPSAANYRRFLLETSVDTRLYEFREGRRLVAVALTDVLQDGLSAVYTWFDPDDACHGPGTYAILWQVAHAQRLGLPYVYLGYWIAECDKMSYKTRFRPLDGFVRGAWRRLSGG